MYRGVGRVQNHKGSKMCAVTTLGPEEMKEGLSECRERVWLGEGGVRGRLLIEAMGLGQ